MAHKLNGTPKKSIADRDKDILNDNVSTKTHTEGSGESDSDTEKVPECAVCLQTCIHPVRLPCSHIFCFLCVKGVANQSKRCALCRHEIPMDFLNNPALLRRDDLLKESGFSDGFQWYYEGRNGWWQYDERTSAELEERLKKSVKAFEILIAGFLYVIDLEAMVQIRRNDPTRRRRIKRDLASIPKKGVAGLKTADDDEAEGEEEGEDGEGNGENEGNNETTGSRNSRTPGSGNNANDRTNTNDSPAIVRVTGEGDNTNNSTANTNADSQQSANNRSAGRSGHPQSQHRSRHVTLGGGGGGGGNSSGNSAGGTPQHHVTQHGTPSHHASHHSSPYHYPHPHYNHYTGTGSHHSSPHHNLTIHPQTTITPSMLAEHQVLLNTMSNLSVSLPTGGSPSHGPHGHPHHGSYGSPAHNAAQRNRSPSRSPVRGASHEDPGGGGGNYNDSGEAQDGSGDRSPSPHGRLNCVNHPPPPPVTMAASSQQKTPSENASEAGTPDSVTQEMNRNMEELALTPSGRYRQRHGRRRRHRSSRSGHGGSQHYDQYGRPRLHLLETSSSSSDSDWDYWY